MEHEPFHEWLAARMTEAGLTQEQLAAAISGEGYSVTRQAVGMWERGQTTPSRRYWPILAAALGVGGDEVALAVLRSPVGGGA